MKVAVNGSRDWKNKKIIHEFLDAHKKKITEISSGDAVSGADKIAQNWARKNKIPLKLFKPDFKRKHPYHYRNRLLVENCIVLISFWNGHSSGTKYTFQYAKKLEKKVIIVLKNHNFADIPSL